ncbi:MAG: efflux RND transporter periplasmic adaptor subunit [Candidatus Hydrogenedentes bacterium]|nr:efflux RND transporter periplasmic adaptor subunit [Candidatus Hydrogenedentota bacterium]
MPRLIHLAVAASVLIALPSCGGSHKAPGSPDRPSVIAPVTVVTKTTVATTYEAVGTIRSTSSSAIQSKAVGHITALRVKEGDTVQAGQILIELDDRDAVAQVQRAEAALKEAQDSRQAAAGSVRAAMHAKTAAEASGTLAQATFQRYKGLVDRQAVSKQAFDEASARWRGAEAEAAQAGDVAVSVQARASEAEALVAQAAAELSAAKTLLTYTQIAAPFAGVVTRKSVAVGDLAAPGVPLLEIEDTRLYRLEALVDEARVSAIKPGDTVSVTLDAIAGAISGTVAEVVPAADSASRTFLIKVDLPPRPEIRSGMFGRASFGAAQKAALTVPAAALVQQGQLTGVYVVGAENSEARLRLITVGKRYGDTVEVLSGLSAGDRVVMGNTAQVTEGCVIQNG